MKPLLIIKMKEPESLEEKKQQEIFAEGVKSLKGDYSFIVESSVDGPYGITLIHDKDTIVTEICSH